MNVCAVTVCVCAGALCRRRSPWRCMDDVWRSLDDPLAARVVLVRTGLLMITCLLK